MRQRSMRVGSTALVVGGLIAAYAGSALAEPA